MKGALIYAFNNARIDYFQQAAWCADRVQRWLDLPVTLVTDPASHSGRHTSHSVIYADAKSGGMRLYDHVNDQDGHQWFNSNRSDSLAISPYDQTLVLDSDYVVCSDQLLAVFDSGIEVTAMKNVYDVTNRDQFRDYRLISPHRGLHHYWATVLYFRRGQMATDFFHLMHMIQTNYRHYAQIYGVPGTPFRNDFAVTIALNTLYGHLPHAVPELPWSMANVFSDVEIQQIEEDIFDLSYQRGDRPWRVRLQGHDFHFMNKVSLEKLYAH